MEKDIKLLAAEIESLKKQVQMKTSKASTKTKKTTTNIHILHKNIDNVLVALNKSDDDEMCEVIQINNNDFYTFCNTITAAKCGTTVALPKYTTLTDKIAIKNDNDWILSEV